MHRVKITETNSKGGQGPAIYYHGVRYYNGDEVTLDDDAAKIFLGAGWCECCDGKLNCCERVPGQRSEEEILKAYDKANPAH